MLIPVLPQMQTPLPANSRSLSGYLREIKRVFLNTLVTGAVPVNERGGITALYGSARFLGVALGPPLFSLLLAAGTTLALVGGTALTGLTTATVWWALSQGQP